MFANLTEKYHFQSIKILLGIAKGKKLDQDIC